MAPAIDVPMNDPSATGLQRLPKARSRLSAALLLLGLAAAAIGRRELFDLGAEDPTRSVHRFASGATQVGITTQMPWSRVPAVLPGSADTWTARSVHAIAMRLELPTPRALLLYVKLSRARPRELPSVAIQTGDSTARLRILVNGVSLGVFDVPGLERPLTGGGPRALPRIELAIPASVLGGGTSVRITLVNDGPHSLGLRRIRLIEAWPAFSLSHLARSGHFPTVSAALLAIGLGFRLGTRLQGAGDESRRSWPQALGPAMGLLILGLAVAGPAATRALPRWAWLLLVLSVLPLGRRRPPRATVASRPWTPGLARAASNGLLVVVGLVVALIVGELALRRVFGDEPWARIVLHTPARGPVRVDSFNSLGFSEREFPLEKPPGVYRIAILGDSLSISAPQSQRFGDVIAAGLNARAPGPLTYEVVSFGRRGIDTNVETEILQQVAWRAKPDFVLLEFYVNDLENGDDSERPHGSLLIPRETAPARWLRGLADRTLLGWMLQEQFNVVQEHLGLVETYPAYMYERFGDPAGAHWQAAAYELRNFIRECRAHRTPVAIALFPHLSAGLPAGHTSSPSSTTRSGSSVAKRASRASTCARRTFHTGTTRASG
jgi:hypothetical protein